MKRQSVLSLEYVEVLVGARTDPSGDVVKFAFPAENAEPTTLFTGEWDPAGKVNGLWTARILTGPTAHVLSLGRYDVWVQISDSPEVPLLYGGLIEIF